MDSRVAKLVRLPAVNRIMCGFESHPWSLPRPSLSGSTPCCQRGDGSSTLSGRTRQATVNGGVHPRSLAAKASLLQGEYRRFESFRGYCKWVRSSTGRATGSHPVDAGSSPAGIHSRRHDVAASTGKIVVAGCSPPGERSAFLPVPRAFRPVWRSSCGGSTLLQCRDAGGRSPDLDSEQVQMWWARAGTRAFILHIAAVP